ncbi:DUF192 domain-containing protein [Agrobacterium rosae]|uniref:DUF192 domain-containing protein n=1 Tax=Agrobacterium rosae TaxID=1972867 RepID=A0AAE5VPX4_9HYPH|nr:DUF192 domain-containing protein [Agrobacterium rosae]KAA3512243.1 DUF192 domain-containing protein [Agrobacterium rosae]KAA3520309.1 DUF192 domain-containing protein [Agrobacterium rosae]MCM2432190.1 DUF192 domain-containing protein [Agrobacterium rosae]MDX8327671.1 DUF192 domain-containing protein [Agrobacterium rosae]MQB48857.1 DUF192 domain-containing protein [Agrobacterium rosae]
MFENLLSTCKVSAIAALAFFVATVAPLSAEETFTSEQLTIQTSDGKTHNFTVELATTDAQRQQGLMYRKSMGTNNGMLFDFKTDREVTMWMRNTLIPLDMLFISKAGKIEHIHAGAVPHSESIISSRGAVRYVLELNGGAAKNFGIKTGDTVKSAQLGKTSQ